MPLRQAGVLNQCQWLPGNRLEEREGKSWKPGREATAIITAEGTRMHLSPVTGTVRTQNGQDQVTRREEEREECGSWVQLWN